MRSKGRTRRRWAAQLNCLVPHLLTHSINISRVSASRTSTNTCAAWYTNVSTARPRKVKVRRGLEEEVLRFGSGADRRERRLLVSS